MASPQINETSFNIRGTEIHYEPKKNSFQVIGDAVAKRIVPSVNDEEQKVQLLKARKFYVVLNDSEQSLKKSSDTIKKIICEEKVMYKEDNLTIKADNCVYFSGTKGGNLDSERIICTGNVILIKGNKILKGDKGEANLHTGIYKVTSSQKVQAIIPLSKNHS